MKFLRSKFGEMFRLGLCALIFAALATFLPAYGPAIQPDSGSYLNFSPVRSSLYPAFLAVLSGLGLDVPGITYVQIVLFSSALAVLLASLRRARVPWWILFGVTVVLGASSYFSTFQRSILTESLFTTLLVLALAFWIDYFRTGKPSALAWTALFVSLGIGVRPAGIALVPMLFVSLWLKRGKHSLIISLAALILPLVAGIALEKSIYRLKHGGHDEDVSRYLYLAKAAMVIRDNAVFAGPHAPSLTRLGRQLYEEFAPVRAYLRDVPAGARPAVTAAYEGLAQFQVLNAAVTHEAQTLAVTEEALVKEFAKQAVAGNIAGYFQLSLIHYAGQWSVMSLTFPPTALALREYSDVHAPPYADKMSDITLRPEPKRISWVIYPAFLLAGVVTLGLSLLFVVLLIRPAWAKGDRGQYLMLAAFFSAACQGYTMLLSLVNVSTPRFLLAYYPVLVLVGVFLLLAAFPRLAQKDR